MVRKITHKSSGFSKELKFFRLSFFIMRFRPVRSGSGSEAMKVIMGDETNGEISLDEIGRLTA